MSVTTGIVLQAFNVLRPGMLLKFLQERPQQRVSIASTGKSYTAGKKKNLFPECGSFSQKTEVRE